MQADRRGVLLRIPEGEKKALILAMCAATTALAAPVPKEVKRPSDAIRMQGLWAYDTYDAGNGARGTSGRWYFEKEKMYSGGQNITDKKGTPYGIVLRSETNPSQIKHHDGERPRDLLRDL